MIKNYLDTQGNLIDQQNDLFGTIEEVNDTVVLYKKVYVIKKVKVDKGEVFYMCVKISL